MKIYTLIAVSYDYHEFEVLEGVSTNLDSLISGLDKPVFTKEETLADYFDAPDHRSGNTSHYYYSEWDV